MMKNLFQKITTFFVISFGLSAAELNLESYQWKKRILLLEDTEKDTVQIEKAKNQLSEHQKEIQDREIVILTQGGHKDFKIRLIGKDGGQKWTSGPNFNFQTIRELIDSMPMRQREMREHSQSD